MVGKGRQGTHHLPQIPKTGKVGESDRKGDALTRNTKLTENIVGKRQPGLGQNILDPSGSNQIGNIIMTPEQPSQEGREGFGSPEGAVQSCFIHVTPLLNIASVGKKRRNRRPCRTLIDV
jgi:hypothetical protein